MRGRGKSEQHGAVKREASIPILGIDYMWMTGEDDEGGDESLRGNADLSLGGQRIRLGIVMVGAEKGSTLVCEQNVEQTN